MQDSPEKSNDDSKSANWLKNGTVLSLCIQHVNTEGLGVGNHNGYNILVPDTGAEDEITVHIDHVSKHTKTAWAQLMSVSKRGSQWKKHFCKEAVQSDGRCGGCALGHLAKDVYRSIKLQNVNDALQKQELNHTVSSITCDDDFKYRNKSNFVVNKQKNGTVRLGSYGPRTHRFAIMDGCKINAGIITRTQKELEKLLTDEKAPVHPVKEGVRYLTLKGFESGAVLVDMVVNSDTPESSIPLAEKIRSLHSVHGITITCNPAGGNDIRSQGPTYTDGNTQLHEKIGDISLALEATSFFQLNNEIATRMYRQGAAECDSAATIWDLYCGIGGLGLTAAKSSGAALFGCDNVESAIALATKNGEANEVPATFETTDLSKTFDIDWPSPSVVLVNPPRKGLDAPVIKYLCENRVPKIVYMSCNPATFAKNAKEFCDAGYTLKSVEAFDMLPHTTHVELLGVFE